MKVENIVSFDQTDADEYTLTVYIDQIFFSEKGEVTLTMHGFEAIRLYNLVVKAMVGYVTEMEIAKASHERGEGPNGEAPGTWEHSRHAKHGDPGTWTSNAHPGDVFLCHDPEGDWMEMQRYHADLHNKARKENA